MKILRKKILTTCVLLTSLLEGKNFEVRGTVFPILEDSLTEFFSRRIQEMTPAELAIKQKEATARFIQRAKNPLPIANLIEAVEYRSFYFDPSYTAKEEIKDVQGKVIVPAGIKINPLETISLSSGLLFFDGENEQHIEWAKKQTGNFKWVLVKGSPILLEQKEQLPVYFDQGGKYTSRLQIHQVPARVVQEGPFLLIEEIPVKEGLKHLALPSTKKGSIQESSPQDEIREFLAMAAQNLADPQSSSFADEPETTEKKCITKAIAPNETTSLNATGLFVFISFSVPFETWKDLSIELEKANGVFIVKGIPNNSFLEFAQMVKELRNKGISAPIQIYPQSFEKYGINEVPAIVLDDGDAFDKVSGNIPLRTALTLFVESGATSRSAKKALTELHEGTRSRFR